jgi:hypothetical protein
MPSLEELRRWLRGEHLEGLPDARRRTGASSPVDGPAVAIGGVKVGNVDTSKMVRGVADHRYTISMDGADATLHFGKWKGHRLSDMAKVPEGRSYMDWMLKEGFGADIKDVVNHLRATSWGFETRSGRTRRRR